MELAGGIPTMEQVRQLLGTELYREHVAANTRFLERHGPAMKSYRRKWEFDPYKLWSRRWEYPFVASALLKHLQSITGRPTRLLDAGSGVTYLPYFLCERLPELTVDAVDYDSSYAPMFEAIARGEGHSRVRFVQSAMQQMPIESDSIDAVACVSVLEHTDMYPQIVEEFSRVLRPGGILVLTFDLSLDGRFELSFEQARAVLAKVAEHFEPDAGADWNAQLEKMKSPQGLLSTDAIKASDPSLLPWRHPLLKAAHDLMKGHGWTGGFRSKSVFCLSARAKTPAAARA